MNLAPRFPGPLRLLVACLLAVGPLATRPSPAESPRAVHREPVRLLSAGQQLLVLNRRSGTVTQVDLASRRVAGEWPLGERLGDAVRIVEAGQSWLVASDEAANELILAAWNGDRSLDSHHDRDTEQHANLDSGTASSPPPLRVLQRLAVQSTPTHLISVASDTAPSDTAPSDTAPRRASSDDPVAARRGELYASLRWAHRLQRVELQTDGDSAALIPRETLDLPFSPGPLLATRDGRHLVVADAFGPHLAIVQCEPLRVTAVLRIPGHNVGGLAWTEDGSGLQFTHAMLNDFIPTTRDHVFWGNVVSNMLRVLPRDELLVERPESLQEPHRIHGSLFPLGREGQAAGDPGELLVTARGDLVLAIRGTQELAFRRHGQRNFTKRTVADGPSALWASDDGRTLVVASRFADALTFVDAHSFQPTQLVTLGDLPEPSLVDRGERLFHDARLSLDGWFSCHSCHTEGHTIGLSNDNFGDNEVGAPKRIPSLLGTRGTEPWAWNGSQSYLAGQVRKSLEQTMRSTDRKSYPTIDESWVDAITAYVETLAAPPSRAQARATRGRSLLAAETSDPAALQRGRQLFADRDCIHCHAPPAYTSSATYDVGLADERGLRQFNPPSLRGVSQRFRFLHDGRAGSLREVLDQHPARPGIDQPLTREEQADLVDFLETL